MRIPAPKEFLRACLIACGGFALLWPSPAVAFDPAAGKEVRKLLEIGWQTTVKARPEADQQYAASVRAGGGSTGDYAYFLVLLHQKRYTEAVKHSEQMVKTFDKDAYAWRGHMWAATLTKNYQAALASSHKFAEILAADYADPERGTFVRENVEFLGRMYGYYGGPAGEQVKQEERKALEKQVLEVLPADLRPSFEEARDAVTAQFLGLANQKADEKEKAIAEGEAEKQKTLEDLEKQHEKIDGKREELKDDVERASADLKQEIDQLQKQDLPLQTQLARLQAQYNTVQANLSTVAAEIAILQQQLNQTKDPNARSILQQQILAIDLRAVSIRNNLGNLQGQINGVLAQRQAIANQAAAAQQRYNGQIAQANKVANDLNKAEKKAENVEKVTKGKTITGNGPKVSAIGAQANAIGTYQPFPLEQEKLRLLDEVNK